MVLLHDITVPEIAGDEAFFCSWEAFVMYLFRMGGDSSAVCPPSSSTCIYFPELPHILTEAVQWTE